MPVSHPAQPQAERASRRHPEQPEPRNKSDGREKKAHQVDIYDPFQTSIEDLRVAYKACRKTITDSRVAARHDGERFIDIIDHRIEWLRKDSKESKERVYKNRREAIELGIVPRNIEIDFGHPDLTAFTRRLRCEEDELWRLRSGALRSVADKPSLLGTKIAKDRDTKYEEKIKAVLREVYTRSQAAVAKYEKPLVEAIEKEKARRRLEDGRRAGPPRERSRAR